jgi:HSP20 family protein
MAIIKSNQGSYPSVFNGLFENLPLFESDFFNLPKLPATNVKETDTAFHLELAIPGFKKEDIKVNVEEDILSVSAEIKTEKNEKNEKFARREFSYSSFNRQFQLPSNINKDNIEAKYENGILNLTINKLDKNIVSKNKVISIN